MILSRHVLKCFFVRYSLYEESGLDPPVTYVSWMLFGAPHAIFCLLFAYGWLVLVFLGWRYVVKSLLLLCNVG